MIFYQTIEPDDDKKKLIILMEKLYVPDCKYAEKINLINISKEELSKYTYHKENDFYYKYVDL